MSKEIWSDRSPSRARRATVLIGLCLCLLSLSLSLPFLHAGIVDFEHDGVLFKPAVDLAEGKMIFRDSYCSYGPLPVMLIAVGVSFFGKYLLVGRTIAAVLAALTVMLLFLTWERLGPRWIATVAAVTTCLLSWHFGHPYLAWASTFALFFQSINFYCFILGLQQSRRWLFVVAGAAAGCVFLCKQNVGVYLFTAELCVLPFLRVWRLETLRKVALTAVGMLIGGGVVIGAVLSWLAFNGALRDWWLQNIAFAAIWAKHFGGDGTLWMMLDSLLVLQDRNGSEFRILLIFKLMPLVLLVVFIKEATRLFRQKENARHENIEFLAALLICLAS